MNSATKILLAVLVGSAIVAFFLLQRPGETSLDESGKTRLIEIDTAAVNAVRISSDGSSVSLRRIGPDWYIDSPVQSRADQSAVKGLLTEAANVRIQSIISNNPEKRNLFQVDSTGRTVTFFTTAGDSASVILGKPGPSFTDVYARSVASDDVVLINAAISYSANRSVKEWRDPFVLAVPADQIREITFRYGDTTFALAWKDSVWTVDGTPISEQPATALRSALVGLRADEFPDAAPVPMPRLVARLSCAGIEMRFHQAKGSSSYLIQTSSSPQWYQVEAWKVQQVLKRKADLISLQ